MDELIRLCAAAARVACLRMTPLHLKVLHESLEQARRMPSRFAWDRKVAAHGGIFNLLADVAGDPQCHLEVRDRSLAFLRVLLVLGDLSWSRIVIMAV